MSFKKIKKNIRQKRLGQWLRVNYRFTLRKIKRFFRSPAFRQRVLSKYAKNTYIALFGLVFALLCLVGAHIGALNKDTEGMLLDRLTYGPDYDTNIPYFRTLNALGSSNHLCVTVNTAAVDHLKTPDVSLLDGGVNLKISFTDGSTKELPLTRRYKKDCFSAGKESHFILTLPYGYTPFDISATALALTPGAEGSYDDWLCKRATVSFLLGNKRVLISQSGWSEAKWFGSGTDMVRAADLNDARTENKTYQQTKLLFEKLLKLAEHGLTDFADADLKNDTLESLGLLNASALYMDVETVSSHRNGVLKSELGEHSVLPEQEDLNYNGLLKVTLTFNGRLEDGSHTAEYLLDTPGKDDFELSGASTFRMDLPKGMCVFDISDVSVTLSDLSDAWAPRFVRLYLTLDYEKELEIGRLTDRALETQYDTPIFYNGFLDSPISFDLRAQNAIPEQEAEGIKETYGHTLSDGAYSMYFEKQSFYSRQIRFFEQMEKLYAPTKTEDAQ